MKQFYKDMTDWYCQTYGTKFLPSVTEVTLSSHFVGAPVINGTYVNETDVYLEHYIPAGGRNYLIFRCKKDNL